MLQWEHSAILSTFIKLPFVIKIFVLPIFEWPFYTGFTVQTFQYSKCSKILSTFLLLFSKKLLAIRAWIHKIFVRIANMEDPNLTASEMSRSFWQATSVQNFRTFTVSEEERLTKIIL